MSEIDNPLCWPFFLPLTLRGRDSLAVYDQSDRQPLAARLGGAGVVVGAALAVSSTALQAMRRNPLSAPYRFGVSVGAA